MDGSGSGLIWAGALRHIHSLINHIEDLGGVESIGSKWRPETTDKFIAELAWLGGVLNDWEQRLARSKETPPAAVASGG